MDLSHSQSSNLSLGFLTHASSSPAPASNHRSRIVDDSISFQIDSNFQDPSHPVPQIPLQLMESQTDNQNEQNGKGTRESVAEKEEEFRIFGHSMCFKRQRDSSDYPSSSSSSL